MQLPTTISPVHLAVPAVLILLRVVYLYARPFFAGRSKSNMNYVVKWGKERLTFPLPSPDTKLGVIRQQLADYTQLPPHSFKLVHAGAVMKDDNSPRQTAVCLAPSPMLPASIMHGTCPSHGLLLCRAPRLPRKMPQQKMSCLNCMASSCAVAHPLSIDTVSSYGINEKSKLAIIGGGDNNVPSSKSAPERATQDKTITKIHSELEKVRKTLQPDVDEFLASLNSIPTATTTATSPQPTARSASSKVGKHSEPNLEHARLGELLLQSLLRLDAINADGEWEEARKERKGAVREVQSLLDRLDLGWRARTKT